MCDGTRAAMIQGYNKIKDRGSKSNFGITLLKVTCPSIISNQTFKLITFISTNFAVQSC